MQKHPLGSDREQEGAHHPRHNVPQPGTRWTENKVPRWLFATVRGSNVAVPAIFAFSLCFRAVTEALLEQAISVGGVGLPKFGWIRAQAARTAELQIRPCPHNSASLLIRFEQAAEQRTRYAYIFLSYVIQARPLILMGGKCRTALNVRRAGFAGIIASVTPHGQRGGRQGSCMSKQVVGPKEQQHLHGKLADNGGIS